MNENVDPPPRMQPTTPEAIAAAHEVLARGRHGALATVTPGDGHPMATRVGMAQLGDGTPFILVSELSPHTQALRAEPRCSLLVGEVGRGDPLAYPRVSLRCVAAPLTRTDALRATYLAAHPKASLYIDLADFVFFAMRIEQASFIAGFGRAYRFSGAEFRAG